MLRKMTLLLPLSFLFVPRAAMALCEELGDRVRSLYSQSDAVFVGTVIDKNIDSSDDGDGLITYHITPTEILKGLQTKQVVLKEENASGRIGLDAGKTYLIFASTEGSPEGKPIAGVLWPISYGCVSSDDFSMPQGVSKLAEAYKAKSAAAAHEPASIRIRVLEMDTGSPVNGSPFLIEGMGISKTSKTDKDGWLWMELAPGHYRIHGIGPNIISTQTFEETSINFDVKEGGGWDQLFYDHGKAKAR